MNQNLPEFATPVYHDGKQLDDTGRRVFVNSVSGALHGTPGVVVYGPYQFSYTAQSKVEESAQKKKKDHSPRLKPKKFITEPYWCVRLDGYNLEVRFQANELEFKK